VAEGASIGDVYVTVLPKSDSFWAKFVAQNRTQAGAVGDELGGAIGKQIADAISKGIRDGLGKAPREPAVRSGTESGGAFADAFKRRVEAALKAMPKAQIGAATDEAEQKIRDLRADLVSLSGKKVGVDIDAAAARAEIDRIRTELDRLAVESPNVQVRVDAARASAEVAAFTAEVDRLDGRTAHVDVDASSADAATGSVRVLTAAGLALGPAIVPGAAAAVAAIAAITPAAIAAVGGIGVLALAAAGVVGAVKAMSAADDQATQSAVSLAGKQAQVASASDAVRSAQASLANTVANAADQQRRAEETITNSVRSEVDAQRQLSAAQQAVTQARIDAARAAEDLQSRVAHNALDQQQAALDTQKAEDALAAARTTAAQANTPANNRAVQEAQLALQQQQLRARDLATEQKRLAADKATADRQGIDGSTQVVAALDRVRQATEAVHKAEQATADARAAYASQARQQAFAVAQAQQGVVSAQRALEQATVSTATAGGAALEKLRQSMADLSPEGQRFAAFIYGLKPALLDVRRTAEAGLLPGVQSGIEALLPTLPRLIGHVHAFAGEMGSLAQRAGVALASPFWQNFFDLLTARAIPAMDLGGRVAGNFAVGIAGLVRAFLPIGENFGQGLLNFSRNFALYGVTLQNTAGYRQFLDYVRTEGPIVAQTVGEVVQAVIRLVQAVAPIGGVSLTTIRLLAETINALPVAVITATAAAIIAVTTATKLMAFGQVIAETKAFAAVQLLLSDTLGGVRRGVAGAGPEVGRFGTAIAGVKGGAQAAASGVGGLLDMVGLGGPLGIGLAAGTLLIGTWANAHAAAQAKIERHKRAVDDISAAIRANSGAIDENVRKVAAKKALDDGALAVAQKTGVSLSDVTNAYIHGGTAVDAITAQLEQYIAAQQEAAAKDQEHSSVYTRNIKDARNLIDTLDAQKKAVSDNTSETQRASSQQKLLDEAMRGVQSAAAAQTPEQQTLGNALRVLADNTKTASDRAGALKAADDAIFGSARNAITAEQDQALALLQVAAAGKQNADQQLVGKATLDLHSQASINNRQMLEQRFLALGQQYLADVQSGVAVGDATKKHDTNRDAIVRAAEAAGFDTVEVHRLADTFGTLPTDPKVQVTVSGVQEALTQLQNLEIAQLALKQGLDPAEATRQWKAQHQQAQNLQQGLAAGGPVFGPGGPTDDLVPALGPGGVRYRLSNDEHIVTAAEVKAAGGHGAIMAWRKWLLGDRPPQVMYPGDGSGGLKFAGGGAVTWPFPATAAITKIPSLDDVKRVLYFGPNFTGDISGGLAAAVAFVQNVLGSPYGWASAGPYSWDCSGIVSSAWNVAHGRNPYSHTFSTANEAGFFPLPGYGPFTAAWTNPGESGVGGGPNGVGHTAARIGNFAFESVGGQGVRAGSSVTALGRFAHIGHYDDGGVLPPGLTIACNDTGRNEFVLRDDQLRAVAGRGGGRPPVEQHFHVAHMPAHELAATAQREFDWASS
jgi:hypothetical protein